MTPKAYPLWGKLSFILLNKKGESIFFLLSLTMTSFVVA